MTRDEILRLATDARTRKVRAWRGASVLLILALLFPVATLAADDGVLAELEFLDAVDHPLLLYPAPLRVDLSPRPERPLPMRIATGSSRTVMTALYSNALGVSLRRQRSSSHRRSTRLGRDLEFTVDPLERDRSGIGLEYGRVGSDFLAHYVLDLDYRERRLRFLDPSEVQVPQQGGPREQVLPLVDVEGRPGVELSLGPKRAVFVLSTGEAFDLRLSEASAGALGIHVPDSHPREIQVEQGGRLRSASFFVPKVEIGAIPVRNLSLEVVLSSDEPPQLGNGLLSRFRVRIDYPNGRLGLQPLIEPPPDEVILAHLADAETRSESAVYLPGGLVATRAAARYPQRVWLQLETPADGEVRRDGIGWAEVRGWAGAGQRVEHDLVVLIDVSGSTAIASGSDVDGDGKVGKMSRRARDSWRSFNPSRLSSDDGDTVLAAELVATARLVERLDPASARVGLISFANAAKVEAPVGSDRAHLERVQENLRLGFGSGATNMARAIELATEALLLARPPGEPDRRQSILLLSDGYPTAPHDPEQAAYEAARVAASHGIRIYTFALGIEEPEADDIFPEIAFVTGGQYVRVDEPGEIVHELARIRLTDIARVEIENATTGEAARALRVFPDGTFDAFVRLKPGANALRIEAIGNAGGRTTDERSVTLPVATSDPEPAALEAFQRRLRERSTEVELGARARSGRVDAELDRELEIAPEGD